MSGPDDRAMSGGLRTGWLGRGVRRGGEETHSLSWAWGTDKGRRRVLVAEDDVEMRTLVASALRQAGYEVEVCGNGLFLLIKSGSGLDLRLGKASLSFLAAPETFDLIISDIRMPGASGLEILEHSRRHPHYPPVILMTAFGDEITRAQARRLGAVAILDKPFDLDQLLAEVAAVVPA